MDLDAYVAAHQHEWNRLRVLVRRRRLSGEDADELLDLYQRVATHLSQIRSGAPDPMVVQMLSGLVADARTKATGVRTASWAGVGQFFAVQLPGMLYRTRAWWLSTLVVNVLLAFAIGIWVDRHPGVQTSFVPADQLQNLVQHEFSGYYSQYAAQDFAAHVWTNNAWIAAVCIATGVLGLPVIYLLWMNTLNVGVMGGIMSAHGRSAEFFGLILPHGMLELTAVFVAAGVGLRLCWTWIEPGPRRRADALAEEVRSSVVVVLGLVLVLLVSGVIEAFVTPSGLPTWARIGIGAAAEVGFLAYVFVIGRRAVLSGQSSDVADIDRAAAAPVAA
ncbi:stage II sporulation protein M [Leekyejoonella antrihumi]|uniref:Stage II sporulation protein M n=1 Tax=Leekyejoonella antrihumi TaxID=1660198 RepID=A0A563DTE2_9MICO|nr:stage II sporulation protein M [Leekyejoonella antrihumi]TWP33436.1 stage II sporulation protein M [Leekyejoonella antrihumi]